MQKHHPAASAWFAEPLQWMAAVGRTGRLGGKASRGTSPDQLKTRSEVQEASLDRTGGNGKKVKGSLRKDLIRQLPSPCGPLSLSNIFFARTAMR